MSIQSPSNQPLPRPLRAQLESAVKAARDAAEKGAHAALRQMAVEEARAPDYLTEELKALRRRLRAHGRALGDVKAKDDAQGLQHLVWEVAYEHWHRMLFARFLAENGLLLWEPGAAVALDDCEALVQEADPAMNLGAKSKWELAAKLAARMLPQVFKPHSPVFEVAFAPEHQRELERLLAALPAEVFKASDSLGWVYQFWQAKRKDEVNASEVKIGADELPAVTQLFTEPYMVDFLLHNSLGAWWITRHPDKECPVPLPYLRTLEDGTPAAGKFEGWPDRLNEFKLLDPCCGSGHFLVAAFLLLVPMRMAIEGLSAREAVDAVLAENLHGLELDARCVEIAVFALALAAWRFLDENGDPLGVRNDMPAPQVACCGLKVAAKPEDWMALVPEDAPNVLYLRQELRLLHASFAQAPLLGSLLDPARSLKNDLATSNFETVRDLLGRALAYERPPSGRADELQDDSWDLALTAKGLLDAARLLNARYHLVVTNVPYLGIRRQQDALRSFCESHFQLGRHDLAAAFLLRLHELAQDRGVVLAVSPASWLQSGSYEALRRSFLTDTSIGLLAKLGTGAFDGISGEVVNVVLTVSEKMSPAATHMLSGIDLEATVGSSRKADELGSAAVLRFAQSQQLKNPDARILLTANAASSQLLTEYAESLAGIQNGDSPRFLRKHWEIYQSSDYWVKLQVCVSESIDFGGCDSLIAYDMKAGHLRETKEVRRERLHDSDQRGKSAWGKPGVLVSRMGDLPVTLYSGAPFDQNAAIILPRDASTTAAIYAYCKSPAYLAAVRSIDSKLNVTSATLSKVPFDLTHWQSVAAEMYPNGLPRPYSDDPTQWLFHGHPQPAAAPLQVAVARLAGYRWPSESDKLMELADESLTWIRRCEKLAEYSDDDGIVCLPSVRGEATAHDRLLKLLIASWEAAQPGSWKPAVLEKLLADAESAGKGLEGWLRDKFFEQHVRLFQHRPFIWHVWDGLKDGFSALVNYHRLDAKKLERLIHTYLGDWIRQQEAGVRDRIDGATQRLAAARDLKRRLELIQEGEPPYDIFVRWKSLAQQPVGWNPDLNDGVRLNIRPFVMAEVLRHNKKPKLNISWDKDRGKDVESAPWFKVFSGDRINDHHLTLAEKRAAREARRG